MAESEPTAHRDAETAQLVFENVDDAPAGGAAAVVGGELPDGDTVHAFEPA